MNNTSNTTTPAKAQELTLMQECIETLMIGAFVGAFIWCMMAMSACGISTPGGYVAGSTSYLAEYNQGGFMQVQKNREVQ